MGQGCRTAKGRVQFGENQAQEGGRNGGNFCMQYTHPGQSAQHGPLKCFLPQGDSVPAPTGFNSCHFGAARAVAIGKHRMGLEEGKHKTAVP